MFCCYRTWSLQEAKDEGKRIIFGRQFQPLCCTSQQFIWGLKWAKRNWKWFLTESSSVIIKVKNRKNRYWSLRKTGLTHLSKGPNDLKLSGTQLMHYFWLSIWCAEPMFLVMFLNLHYKYRLLCLIKRFRVTTIHPFCICIWLAEPKILHRA